MKRVARSVAPSTPSMGFATDGGRVPLIATHRNAGQPQTAVRCRSWIGTWTVAGSLALAAMVWPRLLEPVDGMVYDLLAPTVQPATRSVLIEVDDASLAQLGRWPWSRSLHALLLDRLHSAGADRTAFALLFSEDGDAPGDAAFAQALARTPGTVLGYTTASAGGSGAGVMPLPMLARHAVGGRIDVRADNDGIVRRLSDPTVPINPIEGTPPAGRSIAEVLSGARTGTGTLLMPSGTVPIARLSFVEALHHPRLSRLVAGKTVFVGFSAAGLGEQIAVSRRWGRDHVSGAAFHARAFEALNHASAVQAMPAGHQYRVTLGLVAVMLLVASGLERLQRRRAHASAEPAVGLGTIATAMALPALGSAALVTTTALWWSPVTATLALTAALGVRRLVQLADVRRETLRTHRDSSAVLSAIGDAVVVVSPDGNVRQANPSAQALALEDTDGLPLLDTFAFDAISRQALAGAMREVQAQADGTRAWRLPQPLIVRHGGDSRALQATLAPLHGTGSASDGLVIALTDITESARAAQDLRHAAEHDELTGLVNRSVLPQRLAQALAMRPSSSSQVAVLFLDLDRFKRINDSLGHRRGDEVLRVTAERLRQACDPCDTVARWGGDEFVMLVGPVASTDEAARRTARVLDAVSEDIELDGMAVSCTGSIGMVLAPQDGDNLDTLLTMADAAMFRAKAQPGATWQRWLGGDRNWTRERLHLEADIRTGLQKGQFRLYYQPQVSLSTGQLVGFEALLRWMRPDGVVISPATVIEVAEESSLILELGEWALRDAVRTLSLWYATDGPSVPVSVNLSANQCRDPRLPALLREILADTSLPPERLKLEITETAAMREPEQVRALLEEVHAMGLGLALDDFGTGYSSLAYLKRFPIDQIKIDRSFVRGIESDRENGSIVRATVALAHSLGLPVVAEGVETPAERARLMQLRCDVAQGHLYAPALPADEAARWQVPVADGAHRQRDLWNVGA